MHEGQHVFLLLVAEVEFTRRAGEDKRVEIVEVLPVGADFALGDELGVGADVSVPEAGIVTQLPDRAHGIRHRIVLEAFRLADDEDALFIRRRRGFRFTGRPLIQAEREKCRGREQGDALEVHTVLSGSWGKRIRRARRKLRGIVCQFRGMGVAAALLAALLFLPAEDYVAEGVKALDANQPAQAEPLFRKAIEADPKDYAAHFNLAFALIQQHKDTEAIAELRKTLELKPGLYEANLNLGILLLRNRQPVDAAVVLKEAAAAKPKEFRPNLYLGDALLGSGDAAGAAAAYQAAVDADAKSAPAQAGLAEALLRQGKPEDAAVHFRAAAAIDAKYRDRLL